MPVLCFIVFAVMAAFALLLPSLMFFLENLGASKATATQVLAAYSFAQFVAGPILGRISDKLGRKPVIAAGLTLSFLCYLFLAVKAASVGTVAIGLIGAGLCSGIVAVVLATVADITADTSRAKNMGAVGASIGFAFTAGPGLGAYLAATQAQEATIEAQALVSCIVLLMGLLTAIRFIPTAVCGNDTNITVSLGEKVHSFHQLNQRPILRIICLSMFVFTVALAMMEPVLPYLVNERYAWGPRDMGYLFAYVGLLIIIVQGKLVGPLSQRFGSYVLVKSGIIMMAVGLLTMILTPVSLGILAGLTFTSVGGAIFNTSVFAITSHQATADGRGVSMGLVQSMQALGRSFGPLVAGGLYQVVPTFPLSAGVIAMGVAFFGALTLSRLVNLNEGNS